MPPIPLPSKLKGTTPLGFRRMGWLFGTILTIILVPSHSAQNNAETSAESAPIAGGPVQKRVKEIESHQDDSKINFCPVPKKEMMQDPVPVHVFDWGANPLYGLDVIPENVADIIDDYTIRMTMCDEGKITPECKVHVRGDNKHPVIFRSFSVNSNGEYKETNDELYVVKGRKWELPFPINRGSFFRKKRANEVEEKLRVLSWWSPGHDAPKDNPFDDPEDVATAFLSTFMRLETLVCPRQSMEGKICGKPLIGKDARMERSRQHHGRKSQGFACELCAKSKPWPEFYGGCACGKGPESSDMFDACHSCIDWITREIWGVSHVRPKKTDPTKMNEWDYPTTYAWEDETVKPYI